MPGDSPRSAGLVVSGGDRRSSRSAGHAPCRSLACGAIGARFVDRCLAALSRRRLRRLTAPALAATSAPVVGTFEVIQIAVFVGVIGAALLSAIWLIRERARTFDGERVAARQGRRAQRVAAARRRDAQPARPAGRRLGQRPQEAGTGRHAAAGSRRARGSRRLPGLRPLADAAFGRLARPCADGAAREIGRLRPHRRGHQWRAARGAWPQDGAARHRALHVADRNAARPCPPQDREPAAARRPRDAARPDRCPRRCRSGCATPTAA